MTNTDVKTQKLIDWLKKNWIVLPIGIGILVVFFFLQGWISSVGSRNAGLQKMIQTQHAQHVRSLAELTTSFEREREEQKRIQQAFDQRINELDQQYTDALSKIRNSSSARRRQLEANPSELSGAIEQTFGIPSGDPQ